MARATTEDILSLLREAGASDEDASRIVTTLETAGLNPPQMRAWLSHPSCAYPVTTGTILLGVDWKHVAIHAIEDGRADAVIHTAEEFAAATEDERFISMTLLCGLDGVRRLTHGNAERTAMVKRIAQILLDRMRKQVIVNETLQTTLSGDFEDTTRLVDWMLDERLPDAVEALERGTIDPVELHGKDNLYFVGW